MKVCPTGYVANKKKIPLLDTGYFERNCLSYICLRSFSNEIAQDIYVCGLFLKKYTRKDQGLFVRNNNICEDCTTPENRAEIFFHFNLPVRILRHKLK